MNDRAIRTAPAATVAVCATALAGAVLLTAPERSSAAAVIAAPGAPDAADLGLAPPEAALAVPRGAASLGPLSGPAADAAAGTAPLADPPEPLNLSGWVDAAAPGFGEAWAVEAYRLTPGRTAVVETRRVTVCPDGRWELAGLEGGPWQTALVAPRFAWGPLVEGAAAPERALRLRAGNAGGLVVHALADGAAPRDVKLRASLTAVRSPALASAPVAVMRRVATRDLDLGESWSLEELCPGTYEVRAELLAAAPDWGPRPRARRAEVVVRTATVHVELDFGDLRAPGDGVSAGKHP